MISGAVATPIPPTGPARASWSRFRRQSATRHRPRREAAGHDLATTRRWLSVERTRHRFALPPTRPRRCLTATGHSRRSGESTGKIPVAPRVRLIKTDSHLTWKLQVVSKTTDVTAHCGGSPALASTPNSTLHAHTDRTPHRVDVSSGACNIVRGGRSVPRCNLAKATHSGCVVQTPPAPLAANFPCEVVDVRRRRNLQTLLAQVASHHRPP